MKIFHRITLTIPITLLLVILACNTPQPTPTEDVAAVVAQTQTALAVEQFLTSTSIIVQISPTAPPATSSPIPPTNTPSPTATSLPECTDKAKFESETIPDETSFSPGSNFVKGWTLSNVGTCTWSSDYSLVFFEGNQMEGPSPVAIDKTVPPEGLLEISLPLIAPQEPGEYESYWMLQNSRRENFGIGDDADVAIWVKIIVADSGDSLEMGPPSWEDTFTDEHSSWDLGEDQDTIYEITDDGLVITAKTNIGDMWRIARHGSLSDFYMEAEFTTGEFCTGKDSYGLLVRAPDQPDGIIDSGYVFGFSCDGNFRVYRMDNGSYTGLITWSESPYILPGPDQTNLMGIQAVGDTLQLFANGTLVTEVTDNTYAGGIFGPMIRSESTPGFQVLVRRIAYWK